MSRKDRKSAKARFRYFLQGGTHYSAGEARPVVGRRRL